MAHFVDPINTEVNQLARVTKRTEDDLPDRVKEQVHWRRDQPSGEGYYILNPRTNTYTPLKFINNYWYRLRVYTGQAYTSKDKQIRPYHNYTGYWSISDWQHPDHRVLVQQIATETVEALYQRDPVYYKTLNKAAEERYQRLPRLSTLTVHTAETSSLVGDPAISPFITAQSQATPSPSFTEPQTTPDHEESDSTEEPPSSTTDKPSPEQVGQEEPVTPPLIAQLVPQVPI